MIRYGLSLLMLLAVGTWLFLSYLPEAATWLPVLAFDASSVAVWFAWLAGLALTLFAVIQLVLLVGTSRMLRRPSSPALAAAVAGFGLRYGREMMLTALPLAMTLALAGALYWMRR